MAQSLHRNVKACLVLKEEGVKEGADYLRTLSWPEIERIGMLRIARGKNPWA